MLGLRSVFSKLMVVPRPLFQPAQSFHLSHIDLRARKGTRERKAKIAKKNRAEKLARIAKLQAAKVTKVGYISKDKKTGKFMDKHATTDWKAIATDDAYPMRYYRWPSWKVADAINFHKEVHHPTMYDALNAPLNVAIEMNMIGDKPTRFVSNFQKLVEHGQERKILVFAKEEENRTAAINAGATTVGGSDLVKQALKGNVRFNDYQYVLAHPDIMPEMLALRGLMKKNFPSPKNETLGVDLEILVKKFMNGLIIQGKRDEYQSNFGVINTLIGTLDYPTWIIQLGLSNLDYPTWICQLNI